MVITGEPRGNAPQLAKYLVTKKDNDRIEILEVNGRTTSDRDYLRETIHRMGLFEELTKSDMGMYHAQISPGYGEDKTTDWTTAADILGEELGLSDQPRVIVLHEKKGRTHAHVVWQRYDAATGKMKSDKYSRLAQDRARKTMERVFEHQQTAERNAHRPELKETVSRLWNETTTGKEFLQAVRKSGHMIAAGSGRNPYVIIDENGHSFNLPRYVKDARLKDIRARLRNETLMPQVEAIDYMRAQNTGRGSGKAKTGSADHEAKIRAAHSFAENRSDIFGKADTPQPMPEHTRRESFGQFRQSGQEQTEAAQTQTQADLEELAKEFAANASTATAAQAERARRKREMIEEQNQIAERAKRKRKGKRYSIAVALLIRLLASHSEMTTPKKSDLGISYLWNKGDITARTQPLYPDPKPFIYGVR